MKAREEKRIVGIVEEAVVAAKGVYALSRPIQVHATKEEDLTIDVFLTVNYGTRIPTVCWVVQKKAKELLNGSGYKKINAINILVEHVKTPHL